MNSSTLQARSEADFGSPIPEAPAAAAPFVIPIVPAAAPASLGFAAIRPTVAAMLADLAADPAQAAWLRRFRPEMAFLFPALAREPDYRDALVLSDIAVGPSRRRLHKESEQIFRVTQAIVQVMLRWIAVKRPGPVEIVFDDLEALDEQSLRVFLRLVPCAKGRGAITVRGQMVARDPALCEEPITDATLAPFVGRLAMRRALIAALRRRVPIEDVPAASAPANPFAASPTRDGGETAEAELAAKCLVALDGGDPATIGPALVAAIEASVFTQNYDHALWLVERAQGVFARLARADRREVLIHLAILRAFTIDYPLAMAAMEASLAEADTPRTRAESTFFLGLLLVKRVNRPEEGRGKLREALAMIEGQATAEADCERAWLHNVMALSYVTEKNLKPARVSCQNVLASLRSAQRSPDATHIKINIISNLTMLDEYEKHVEDALARWNYFDPLLKNAGPVFAKHHLFRKAGLLVKLGRWEEAVEAFERCFALARSCDDAFYGDVIARAVGGVLYRRGRFGEAARWYAASLEEKAVLLEDRDGGRVALALLLARARAEPDAKPDLAPLGPFLAGDDLVATRLTEAVEELESGGPDAVDKTIEAWATPLPETKLNRPFDFTNLY